MALILRKLTERDEAAFFAGLREWDGEDPSWYTFAWELDMPYADMLEILRKDSAGIDTPPGRVPSTMYYAFVNSVIVGRLHIRHELNESLRHRGGHMGYAVAPRYRRLGYAREMVKQALPICTELGIGDILVTCAETNAASKRVIESTGGVLENIVWDNEDKEMICRYWIKR